MAEPEHMDYMPNKERVVNRKEAKASLRFWPNQNPA